MVKTNKIVRTPFKKQADIISAQLRNNPMVDDTDKASMQETVGVLTWLNQLQLHWAKGNKDIPDSVMKQVFEGREPKKLSPPDNC